MIHPTFILRNKAVKERPGGEAPFKRDRVPSGRLQEHSLKGLNNMMKIPLKPVTVFIEFSVIPETFKQICIPMADGGEP
ncbi:hypothetical protein X943_003612 [Babesia divergens]|uniref:Uncharacterized protein n=1 Tax=Babesia divergens TaxID=32595 RepID=A0AAD9LJX7_BABDI|nr:hypothetical protein X943_003612 [Babesia divergens]